MMLRTLLAVNLIFSHVCSTVVSTSLSKATGDEMIVKSEDSKSLSSSNIPVWTFCGDFWKCCIGKLSTVDNSVLSERSDASTSSLCEPECLWYQIQHIILNINVTHIFLMTCHILYGSFWHLSLFLCCLSSLFTVTIFSCTKISITFFINHCVHVY